VDDHVHGPPAPPYRRDIATRGLRHHDVSGIGDDDHRPAAPVTDLDLVAPDATAAR